MIDVSDSSDAKFAAAQFAEEDSEYLYERNLDEEEEEKWKDEEDMLSWNDKSIDSFEASLASDLAIEESEAKDRMEYDREVGIYKPISSYGLTSRRRR